jgi:CRP-like cAMP-binding protein
MADKNLLSGFKFFSDIDADTLEMIARKGAILEFKPNDVIFHVGAPAEQFYGLLAGEVHLSLVFKDKVLKTEIEYEEAIQAKMVDEEKSIVVDMVRPGQVFGWAALVGAGRRTVAARCAEASRVIALKAVELKEMFERDHTLGYLFMKRMADMISKRLKNRTDKLIATWGEAFDVDRI